MVGPTIFILTIQFLNTYLSKNNLIVEAQTKSVQNDLNIKTLSLENIANNLNVTSGVIIQIIDFNTVKVLLDDGMQEVNLIGISKNNQCTDELINSSMQHTLLGKKVYMIEDKSYSISKSPYRYRYLFSDNLELLNQKLIQQGVSKANSSDFYLYKDDFIKSQSKNEICQIKNIEKEHITYENQKHEANNFYSKFLIHSTPIPTKTPIPTPSPTLSEQTAVANKAISKPSSLNSELLFIMINNHRISIGKPPFEKDERLCSLARERGPELYDEIFVNYNVHAGLNNRNLPYWITENMAHYDTEEKVFNWWMNSSLHKSAIEGDFKYSCGECYGNSCAQLFTSWVPK